MGEGKRFHAKEAKTAKNPSRLGQARLAHALHLARDRSSRYLDRRINFFDLGGLRFLRVKSGSVLVRFGLEIGTKKRFFERF